MIDENIDINQVAFENVQTSNRTAEALSRLHGFESLDAFAESLPENAKVADVGAGDSTLGTEVALLRPDVLWINVDYSYFKGLPEHAQKDTPTNISYVATDATKLCEILEPNSQDVVLSYFMLPHLSLKGDELVDQIAREMFRVTKAGGLLSVGPDMSQMGRIPVGDWPPAFQVTKDEKADVDSFAARTVRNTRAQGLTRLSLLASSEVIAPFFGTSRYLKRDENKTALVYDPKSGEYVSPYSSKGVRIAKDLAVAGGRYVTEQHRNKIPTARKAAIATGTMATAIVAGHHIAAKRRTRS